VILLHLTGALLKRLAREGIVVRSLLFPPAITGATLLLTLIVVALTRTPTEVAVSRALYTPELAATFANVDMLAWPSDSPAEHVASGRAGVGTDGHTLWITGLDRPTLLAESALRVHLGSSWRPDPGPLPKAPDTEGMGTLVARILVAIYALYGIVFGAGMVARDRDDGTLEVELSLPIPLWFHGAARWLAGSLILAGFLTLAVWQYHALAGVGGPGAMVRHGIAATSVSTALGLASVGNAGIKTGFAASLAGGLTVATGLLGLGYAAPSIGTYLPLASVMAGGEGWMPLLVSALAVPAALAIWTRRSARS
jgi:hypothetical protein